MTISLSDSNVYTDLQGLQKLRNAAEKNSPEALRAAAQQFEALFIQQLLKTMRAAKLSEGILDSEESEFYLDMYDKQIALDLSMGQGIGLADMIVEQLRKSYIVSDKAIESDNQTTSTNNNQIDLSMLSPFAKINYSTLNNNKNIGPIDRNNQILVEKAPVQSGQNGPLLTADTVNFSTKDRFVENLWPLAKLAGNELGVDPKIIIAQTALETGWGKYMGRNKQGMSSHNLFNIKVNSSWKGGHVIVNTLEFKDGITKQQKAKFRVYDSFNASFNDYVRLIKGNSRYARALSLAGNGNKFIQELFNAGYATDPEYSRKIIKIAEGLPLQRVSSDIKVSSN